MGKVWTFFRVWDLSPVSKEKPCSKSTAKNTKRARILFVSAQNEHFSPVLPLSSPTHLSTRNWRDTLCFSVCTCVFMCVLVSDHPELVTDQRKPPWQGSDILIHSSLLLILSVSVSLSLFITLLALNFLTNTHIHTHSKKYTLKKVLPL